MGTGIRKPLPAGKNRHEWKAAHGFRKFYKTRAEHDIGVSKSYYKPTEKEILEDYLKAIDLLTINDGIKLQGKISTLQRTQDEISLLKLKHENEIKSLRDEMNNHFAEILTMIQKNPSLAQIKPDVLTTRVQ